MSRPVSTLFLPILLATLAATAHAYVLLDPPMRIGDPDLPYTYHIHYDIDEPSIEGDHEFDLVRNAYHNWQHQVPNVDFIATEGDPAAQCGIVQNRLDQISFQDCQGLCGPGGISIQMMLGFAQEDGFWTTGTDTPFVAIFETDIVYCTDVEFDDPDEDWPPCIDAFDLEGLGTHMAGKSLGLGRSEIPEATMHSVPICDSTRRSLHADDIRGFQRLYGDRVRLEVADHDNFNGALSITNVGNLAYTGAGGIWGEGFTWPGGGDDHIYECSMAFGSTGGPVSDNFRTDDGTHEGLELIQRSALQLWDRQSGEQTGFGIWDDSKNDQPPYGIKILMRSYSYPDPPDDDYVITCYWLVNESAEHYTNLRVGMFTDFDLNGTFGNDSVDYDADLGLGWISDPSSALQVGWKVLNPKEVVAYRALYAASPDPDERYSDANKTAWFDSDFTRTSLGPGDIAQLIVTGDFNVAPGDTAFAAFALVGGDNHVDLRGNALAAQTKFDTMIKDPMVSGVEEIGLALSVSPVRNAPNPFNPATRISFSLQKRTRVSLVVIDLSGRLIRILADEPLERGHYDYVWDGRDSHGRPVASGVYFSRLRTPTGQQSRKMILLD